MLVTLTRFVDPREAGGVRARLAAEGTPASVAHAHHASRRLLADDQAGTLEDALNAVIGSSREHCPHCGSNDFKRTMPWRERLKAIVIVFVFAPYPTSRTRFICRECGAQWDWGECSSSTRIGDAHGSHSGPRHPSSHRGGKP